MCEFFPHLSNGLFLAPFYSVWMAWHGWMQTQPLVEEDLAYHCISECWWICFNCCMSLMHQSSDENISVECPTYKCLELSDHFSFTELYLFLVYILLSSQLHVTPLLLMNNQVPKCMLHGLALSSSNGDIIYWWWQACTRVSRARYSFNKTQCSTYLDGDMKQEGGRGQSQLCIPGAWGEGLGA